jgi:hypothetical protein
MPIVLNGTTGITTPTYNGNTTAEYLVPVTGFKNRIINGAMVIDQRNAGASVTPVNAQYTLDRWFFSLSQASKLTTQQSSLTSLAGFTNATRVTSSSAYTVGASELFLFRQAVEGFNTADLGWGTANAKTVTLSFWVRSSLTGTFGGSIFNSASNRFYPFSYTISSASTFEYKTITIAGDTSGTWLTTNGIGINVSFSLGAGATVSGTAGSWGSTTYWSATGATSVVGTNGATWDITGVQLEVGSTATSFDYRPYGTELALCQRYYQKSGLSSSGVWTAGSATNASGDNRIMVRFITTTDRAGVLEPYLVQFRANPTLTLYPGRTDVTNTANQIAVYNAGTGCTFTSSLVASPTAITGYLQSISTSSEAYVFQFTADAEL